MTIGFDENADVKLTANVIALPEATPTLGFAEPVCIKDSDVKFPEPNDKPFVLIPLTALIRPVKILFAA